MTFSNTRYDTMDYRRVGRSGLLLPAISLGGWHNFSDLDTARTLMRHAFDLGITHFDFANNYGPPPGSAEENAGRVLSSDFAGHRDELIISSKAGYRMWPGPYGEWGSKKYLMASLDQSLQRLGVDYVDIFYSHRFDPNTPLEETMGALHLMVQQGKALYVGVSNYDAASTVEAARILQSMGTPLTIHQPKYNMLVRERLEDQLLDHAGRLGIGIIAFSPLEQGLLTNKYLNGIPDGSRAATQGTALQQSRITPDLVETLRQLNGIAEERGQSLAQLAIAWALRDARVTSLVVGASRASQLDDTVAALNAPPLTEAALTTIDEILQKG